MNDAEAIAEATSAAAFGVVPAPVGWSQMRAHIHDVLADGDQQAEATLKVMVTKSELMIEGKGRDAFPSANHLHIVLSSNEDWAVPATVDERQFAAFGVSDARQGDKAYVIDLVSEMDGGGLAAMLHDLLAMDLEGWHPRRNIPQTEELMVWRLRSLRGDADGRTGCRAAVDDP